MRFTIFTSFYNYLDTFDQLKESVFNQTYQNWEWIISDDFSQNTEVSNKIKQLVAENPRKVKFVEPEYKKQFYWNPPIKHSTGDIFMVLDSDDMMHPKLLEVYKRNFEVFPEVQMISTNSIMRKESVLGSLQSYRHIKYDRICNFWDKWNHGEELRKKGLDGFGDFGWGDARAWRNKIPYFEDEIWQHVCSEDASKVLRCEELGKVLFLPRTLHTYALRENSISHEKVCGSEAYQELMKMFQNSEERLSRKELNSIHKYYDGIVDKCSPFYLSKFNTSKDCYNIEYYNQLLNSEDKEILKNLYFDQNLYFEQSNISDIFIIQIQDESDINYLNERLTSMCMSEIVIETDIKYKGQIDEKLLEFGLGWYWFSHRKLTYIINT